MEFEIKGKELFLFIDKSLYNEAVLYKCFYWYGNEFSVVISDHSEMQFQVRLQADSDLQNWDDVLKKIKRDLVDFKLRDIVTKETKTIRELIVAKAFAYYETDDDPDSEVSDPVGFHPMTTNN